jgi:hypothetical protein
MLVTLQVTRNSQGQFEGTVETESVAASPFCGTLELLKVLQDVTRDLASAPEEEHAT